VVHEAFSLDKLIALYNKNPDAQIIAHPESETHILKTANYIGSTAGMINYVKTNPNNKFIVATEAGILHKMKQEVHDKYIILRREIEEMPKYQNWRNQVIVKFGNKCEICGVADKLEIHHRQSMFSIIKTRLKKL
jgi:quinolinate synthase